MADQRRGDHLYGDGRTLSASLSVDREDDRAAVAEPAEDTAGAGRGGGGGRHGGRRARKPRRRGKILALTAVGTVLVLAAGSVAVYFKLNGNLRSAPLDLGGTQAKEKTDPFGRSPVNILLIGSDTRASHANCKLGGDCGPGAVHADVEMLVHLSADRSNATIMSIPRDTIVNVPQCTSTSDHVYPAEQAVQITDSLQNGGPGCTVATVHALTGITIDHFVMIDFTGVVKMADDVGGVPVCVSANVYDPQSHLRLTKGTHVISGVQALEFLRTRHGFLYGGDVYRTQAQHMYLSALIRQMKSASTLANPVTLYRLANDATKAVTVDPGLDSISALTGLATDLNKVPTKRITFVTMPNVPYIGNANWLSPAQPAATQLFNDIATDTPLTHSTPAHTPAPTRSPVTASPTPTVDKAAVAITVENGSGLALRAHDVAAALAGDGFTQAVGDTNAVPTAVTSLTYGRGQRQQARAVAKALGLPATALHRSGTSLMLVIGSDWPSGTTFPAVAGTSPGSSASPSPSVSPSPTGPTTPPPGSTPENAASGGQCVQVNPAYTF